MIAETGELRKAFPGYLIAGCALVLAIAGPAAADALADKICPILEQTATELDDKIAEAVQADLVISIGSAYDFDGEALREVTDNIDASAAASCPAARDALLQRLQMDSLQRALR